MAKPPKFLADENVSHRVVEFLRGAGCDVLDVKEIGWCGRSDLPIIRRACRERRTIISHDRDFGTLVIAGGEPCHGIVYLRLKDQRAANVIRALDRMFREGFVFSPRTIIVVSESGIRIRDLM